MVAYGSIASACIVFDMASEPRLWPEGAETMLHSRAKLKSSVFGAVQGVVGP